MEPISIKLICTLYSIWYGGGDWTGQDRTLTRDENRGVSAKGYSLKSWIKKGSNLNLCILLIMSLVSGSYFLFILFTIPYTPLYGQVRILEKDKNGKIFSNIYDLKGQWLDFRGYGIFT